MEHTEITTFRLEESEELKKKGICVSFEAFFLILMGSRGRDWGEGGEEIGRIGGEGEGGLLCRK